MSNVRRFKVVTDEKLRELCEQKLKKRTFAKVQWAVKAFREWRIDKLSDNNKFDSHIYESDIYRVDCLERDSFEFAMCKFIAEVTKVKDGSEYPGKTLYHLCVSIQKYLNTKGVNWCLVEGTQFVKLRTVLDNLMKE